MRGLQRNGANTTPAHRKKVASCMPTSRPRTRGSSVSSHDRTAIYIATRMHERQGDTTGRAGDPATMGMEAGGREKPWTDGALGGRDQFRPSETNFVLQRPISSWHNSCGARNPPHPPYTIFPGNEFPNFFKAPQPFIIVLPNCRRDQGGPASFSRTAGGTRGDQHRFSRRDQHRILPNCRTPPPLDSGAGVCYHPCIQRQRSNK